MAIDVHLHSQHQGFDVETKNRTGWWFQPRISESAFASKHPLGEQQRQEFSGDYQEFFAGLPG